MKILIANHWLKKLGGSETFTYTLAIELKKQGHDVSYFTFEKGVVSKQLEKEGITYVEKGEFDLILASHHTCVDRLQGNGFIIQTCHGTIAKLEQPSKKANAYVAISEEVQSHLKAKGIESTIIFNSINCSRFKPNNWINTELKNVLSMVHSDKANQIVKKACEQLRLNYIRLDKYKDKKWFVEEEINDADLVVGLGRGVYEAMACGRPVVVFDDRKYFETMADGYLNTKNVKESIKNNCSGRRYGKKFGVKEMVKELKKYNAEHSKFFRKFALDNLNVQKNAEKYIQLFESIKNPKEDNQPDIVSDIGNTDVCDIKEAAKKVAEKVAEKIDIVYVLGSGSKWNNNEIKYSLRSLHKNLRNFRNIYIVGEKVEGLKDIIHIPYPDKLTNNADGNIILKVLRACKEEKLSENFMFINDDHFLLKEVDAPTLPNYFKFDLIKKHQSYWTRGIWRRRLKATFDILRQNGLSTLHYDCHTPIILNKKLFPEIMAKYPYQKGFGFTMKSLYANTAKVPATKLRGEKVMIDRPMRQVHVFQRLKDATFFSLKDAAINQDTKYFLSKEFSELSKFETESIPEEFDKALLMWLDNDKRKFQDGLAMYTYKIGNNSMIKFFNSTASPERKWRKLLYYMNQLAGRNLDNQYKFKIN